MDSDFGSEDELPEQGQQPGTPDRRLPDKGRGLAGKLVEPLATGLDGDFRGHTEGIGGFIVNFGDYGLMLESSLTLDFRRVIERAQQVVYTVHEKKQLVGRLAEVGVSVYSEVGDARFDARPELASSEGAV